jgi:hypothetical protein
MKTTEVGKKRRSTESKKRKSDQSRGSKSSAGRTIYRGQDERSRRPSINKSNTVKEQQISQKASFIQNPSQGLK